MVLIIVFFFKFYIILLSFLNSRGTVIFFSLAIILQTSNRCLSLRTLDQTIDMITFLLVFLRSRLENLLQSSDLLIDLLKRLIILRHTFKIFISFGTVARGRTLWLLDLLRVVGRRGTFSLTPILWWILWSGGLAFIHRIKETIV